MRFKKLDNGTYQTVARGSTMTLMRSEDGDWEVWTSNASTRAYNGLPSVRHFRHLKDVEAAYKSWDGIVDHIAQTEAPAWDALDPSGGRFGYSMARVVEQRLILHAKPAYTQRDVEELILDSLFNPSRYGNQTLSPGEARFIVICSAICNEAQLSESVRAATPQAPALAPASATIQ